MVDGVLCDLGGELGRGGCRGGEEVGIVAAGDGGGVWETKGVEGGGVAKKQVTFE